MVGLYGNFGQTNYAATKSAVITMTRAWSRELGRYGIRVNAVAPGLVETEMAAKIPDAQRQKLVDGVPLKRLGRPEEIAAAVRFLLSEDASYIQGQTLVVDGGAIPW